MKKNILTPKKRIINIFQNKPLRLYLLTLATLILGIGGSILGSSNVSNLERERGNAIFERKVSDFVNQLQNNLDRYSQITRFITLSYEFEKNVSANKFETLSAKILPYNRDILAIGEIKVTGDRATIEKIKVNFGREISLQVKDDLSENIEQKLAIKDTIQTNAIAQRPLEKDRNLFILYQAVGDSNNSQADTVIFVVYNLSDTVTTLLKTNPDNPLDFSLYYTSLDRLQSSLMKPQLQNSIQPILNYDATNQILNREISQDQNLKCNLDPEWFKCLRSLPIAEDEFTLLVVPDSSLVEDNSLFALGIGLSLTFAIVTYLLMSVKVQKYYEALELANQNLEDKVKQRTRQLEKAKEAAETSLLAKNRFLVNISHELRSPLNSVIGYTNTLLKSNNFESEELLSLRIIRQSGVHLLSLINEILDYSKAKAKKIKLNAVDTHLPSLLEEIAGMVAIQAREKGIDFQAKISNFLPPGIKADPKILRQILLNLLNNAIKFTDSGQVIFQVIPVKQNEIQFRIIDTGIGIDKQQLDSIFLPFQQAGDEEDRAKGTGLGLSITKELIELIGSEIQVESKLGAGSVFSFNLTVDTIELNKPESNKSAMEIVGYKGEKRKILIVDDLEANRLLLRYILRGLGFDISEAANGQEGLDLANKFAFDLVITDLLMPYKSGLTMVHELRQIENYRNTPILAVSSSSREIMAKRSKKAGCNAFISKPISEPELLKSVQKLLKLEWVSALASSI